MIVEIKVVPSSGKLSWSLDKTGRLTCHLKSAPEGGKANAELIKFLAKSLGLTQMHVVIVGGLTSRHKRVKIARDYTPEALLAALGVEKQGSFLLKG